MNSPFKFLDAYTKQDKDSFFGRDLEIEDMYQKVFESKILLVYGISGTGKTSIINCGLANKFEDSDWLPINVRRGSDMNHSLEIELEKAALTKVDKETSVLKRIKSLYLDYFKPVYLIFDQFEELFIFGSDEERDSFINLIRDIAASDIECRLIFSVREEYLANVSDFEFEIPEFMANKLRIGKMTSLHAKEVIEGSCKVHGIEVEEGFADKLLEKLNPKGKQIELTYLQVYLDKLYQIASGGSGSLAFKNAILDDLGNVGDILGSFLEDQIKELDDPDSGLAVLKSFVSIKGTKRQITYEEISESCRSLGQEVKEDPLKELINKFVDLRILREKDDNGRYELRHDSLASKIYEKITLVEKELLEIRHLLETALANHEKRGTYLSREDLKYIAPYEERLFLNPKLEGFLTKSKRAVQKSKRRRRIAATLILSAAMIILSGLTIWARLQRLEAIKQGEEANAQKLVALEANIEAEAAKKQALEDKQVAEENARIAEQQREIAIQANIEAEAARQEALREKARAINNEQQALSAMDTAKLMRMVAEREMQRADAERIIAVRNYRDAVASNILTRALEETESDPTIALRLAEYAYQLSPNEDAEKIMQKIYRENIFYRIIADTGLGITKAVFSPSGENILAITNDNEVLLMNLYGNILQTFSGHTARVTCAIMSPDEKFVLSGSEDKTLKLWDLEGILIQNFQGHTGWISSLDISPDGQQIISGAHDNTFRIWDRSGKELHVFESEENIASFNEAKFSPDGNSILTRSGVYSAQLRNASGKILKKYRRKNVHSIDFSFTSNPVLLSYDQDYFKLFSMSGDPIEVYQTYTAISFGLLDMGYLSLSPERKTILHASRDGRVELRDLTGGLLNSLKGHAGCITSLSFSPDGKSVLSCSSDNSLRLWSLENRLINSIAFPNWDPDAVISNNDSLLVLDTFEDEIILLNMNGEVEALLAGHGKSVTELAFTPDSKNIISASIDNSVRVWDLQGNVIHSFQMHDKAVNNITVSSDSKYIFTETTYDARLWNSSGNILHTLNKSSEDNLPCAFSPDNKYFVCYNDEEGLQYLSLDDKPANKFEGSFGSFYSLAFSADSKLVIGGSGDGTLYLWSIDGKLVKTITGHDDAISSVGITPDGEKILTGSLDNTLRIWDLSGKLLETINRQDASFEEVIISPDGTSFLAGKKDSTPFLWDFEGNLLFDYSAYAYSDKDKLLQWPKFSYSADGRNIHILNAEFLKTFSIGMPLKEFQDLNMYDELSQSQKKEYGISDVD